MAPYLHERDDWPTFFWNRQRLAERLAMVRYRQGHLLGSMESLGFPSRQEALLRTLTEDVLKSSEIEGENLDRETVRSSIARRLGMDIGGLKAVDRNVEGVVEMMLDATGRYLEPLTAERLFSWHAALFPTGWSGMKRIKVGAWRDDSHGPMQVVSGPVGRERVHYEAPTADRLDAETSPMPTMFLTVAPIHTAGWGSRVDSGCIDCAVCRRGSSGVRAMRFSGGHCTPN